MGNFPAREQTHLLRSACGVSRARYHARLGIPTSPFTVRVRPRPRASVRRRPAPRTTQETRSRVSHSKPTDTNDVAIARVPRRRLRDPRETRHARACPRRTTRTLAGEAAHGSARALDRRPRSRVPVWRAEVGRRRRERTQSSIEARVVESETRSTTVQILDSLCDFSTPRRAARLSSPRDAASASRSIWTGRSRPQTTCLSRTLARDGTRTGLSRASFAISRSRAQARAPPSPPPPPPARRLSRAPP